MAITFVMDRNGIQENYENYPKTYTFSILFTIFHNFLSFRFLLFHIETTCRIFFHVKSVLCFNISNVLF